MPKPMPRKDRLEELLALVRAFRGWNQKDLAKALGRDVHNLVPGSGIPRLDMVLRIAESLDWPLEMVIADLCEQPPEPSAAPCADAKWIDLDRAAYAAAMDGRTTDRLALASKAYAIAETPDQRGYSSLREAGAWDQLGRHVDAIEAARRGLQEQDLSPVVYCELKAALANAHLSLGHLEEGDTLARTLLDQLSSDPRFAEVYDGARGFVRCLLATASRSRAVQRGPHTPQHAEIAREHYASARDILSRYSAQSGSTLHKSISMTCEIGVIEMDVLLSRIDAGDAILLLLERLDHASTLEAVPDACLEAVGCACITGAQFVIQSIADPSLADRYLAIFTNKADEVARRNGHRALRERLWRLEFECPSRREHPDFRNTVLDTEDLRDLAGLMGRSPAFRELGWKLLRGARRVDDE